MNTLEKMARAIYEGRNGPGCKPWAHIEAGHRKPYLTDALAALKAIREPSEDVSLAVLNKLWVDPEDFNPAWRAAIDHIIAQGEAK